MISSTFGGYMIAKLGLSASQQGLYLTGQNLTNAGTPGYTRQRLDQISLNYGATYRYASKYEPNIGNGVLVTGTSQLRDPFLDLRYRNEVSQAAEQDVKLGVLNDLRDILDEVKNAGEDSLGDGGIFNQLGDIIEKFEKYTSEIGSKEFDSMVKASCQALVTLFNSYSRQLDEVREDLNFDLQNVDIPGVNQILSDIQQLNKSISNSELVGQSALELKDERNLLIDELSKYMKINVTYKPVNVTDSTVIDELHISLVGSDGQNYEIIADEQRREFLLSQDGDKTTIGLGALSPVDQELKNELRAAQSALQKAQNIFDNRNQTYADQHKAFAQVQATYQGLQDAIDLLRTGDSAAADESLRPSFEELTKAKDEAAANYTHLLYVFSKPENYPDEQPPTKEELDAAQATMNQAVDAYNVRKNQIRSAEYNLQKYQSTYDAAKFDYEKARKNLDVDPKAATEPLLQDENGQPLKNLLTGGELKGEGLAAENLQAAQDRVKKALDALAQADEKGKAIESINELLTDGKLKGTLEMLNYSAEYDDPPNTIRGIGYYQSMLDTLANKFAQTMNEANNPYIRTELAKDADGRVLYENYTYNPATAQYEANTDPGTGEYVYGTDKDGNKLYEKDKNGQTVYMQDDKGEYILDANGEKIPVPLKIAKTVETTDTRDLFKSRDGNKITAGNIDLADGWVDNSYGITTALNEDDPSGNNTNVLHFINLLNGKLNYKADVNLMDSIKLDFGTGANAQEPSLVGMKKGDTITIDGKTYTFVPGATGQSGNEFKDFETLKMAAERNGVTLTRTPDNPDDMKGVITATTATKDLRNETKVNGELIGNLSKLDVNRLTYGDTVTIDGKTFTYKPSEYPDGTPFADPDKGEFTTLDELVQLAAKAGNNIDISTQITGITTKDADGKTVAVDTIAVNGTQTALKDFDPADIANMADGDTIAINGNTYKFVDPNGATAPADPANGEFSSIDDLIAAAGKDGLQISTGVTEITKKPDATVPVSVDKAYSIQNMATGNSVTVDGKTFTYVDPKEVEDAVKNGTDIEINGQTFTYVKPDDTATPPIKADPAKGEFSDMDTLAKAAAAATPSMTLFSDGESLAAAAEKQGLNIHVNPETMEITTATRPGSNIFDGTFEEYYVSLDATLGLDIKSTAELAETHVTLAGSISDEREAVTGVSHDEEAMNLMRYQQAYTAASRLLTTLDQVLDILLTQTGMVGR